MNDLAKALGAKARDSRLDELWTAEAKDRLAAYRRGELAARDLSDILAKYSPLV